MRQCQCLQIDPSQPASTTLVTSPFDEQIETRDCRNTKHSMIAWLIPSNLLKVKVHNAQRRAYTLPLCLCCNALQSQHQIFADDPTRKLHRPKPMLVSHSKTNQQPLCELSLLDSKCPFTKFWPSDFPWKREAYETMKTIGLLSIGT